MNSKSPWVPYLMAASTIALGTMTITTAAQAANHRTSAVPYSIRLEDQFLATLRYLPVNFKPTVGKTTTTTTTPTSTTTTTSTPPTTTTTLPKAKRTNPTKLQKGRFVWQFDSLPAAFRAQWRVGTNNVILEGALMRFQSVHGFSVTGQMSGANWKALTDAVLKNQRDPMSYNVVLVSQAL